jgi:tetratricopeptide (TPR) repeat protein
MADTLPQTRLMRPVRDKFAQVALLATLGALCACATMPSADTRDTVAGAPPPAASVPAAPLPAAPMSPVASAVPAANHFQAAMQFLQSGEPQRADEELHAYLKLVPDNKPAQSLVAQIEMPLGTIFPSDYFTVKLVKNDTLSSLAKAYLGDAQQFYALARYNNISVPALVREGQTIKIPKTDVALAALAGKGFGEKVPQGLAPATPNATPVVAANETSSKPSAEQYYQDGLIAFQRQDLDSAISNWDKVLAIDPNYKDTQLNRAQALQLKKNLQELKR